MTLSEQKLEYYRKNPTIAAKDLLNVKPNWYQRIMIKTAWTVGNTIWLCCRGAAKTFTAAVLMLLKGMLYPKVKMGIVAGSFPQACETFEKINDIYLDSPILREETSGPPKIGTDEAMLRFKNGSLITAFPLTNKRRGKRLNFLFVDEYGYIDTTLVNKVLRPMLNVKHAFLGKNQMLIASTATYDNTAYAELVRDYTRLIEQGHKDFAICNYDVYDALSGGFLDEQRVENDKLIMLPEEFEMEYLNKFVSTSDGWIKAIDIRAAEVDYKPTKVGEPGREYIIGADIGRAEGGDNSAFAVFEVAPTGIKLVNVTTLNGVKFDEQALVLKQLCRDFNVVRIRMDYDQGGKAVRDALIKTACDPRDGAILNPIVPENDIDTSDARRIIENVNFRNKEKIWSYGLQTKKAIQDKLFTFPTDDKRIVLSADEEDLLPEKDREEIKLYREIQLAKKELTMVKIKPNETGTSFSFVIENPRKNKKDRFTAVILGASAAVDYYKKITETDGDSFVGIWA